MDSRRGLLVIALLFMSFIVYQQWQLDYHTPKPVATEQTVTSTSDVPASSTGSNTVIATDTQVKGKVITLENDVFRLKINTLGGDVISSELLKYDAELDSNMPFVLLQNTPEHVYIAQSGLIGKDGIDIIDLLGIGLSDTEIINLGVEIMRFGIIGTNWITDKLLDAGSQIENFELTAVYSRTEEKAREFADKYNVKNIFTDLRFLLIVRFIK